MQGESESEIKSGHFRFYHEMRQYSTSTRLKWVLLQSSTAPCVEFLVVAGGDKTRSAKATARSEEIPDFFSFFLGHTQDVYFNALVQKSHSGMGFHMKWFYVTFIHWSSWPWLHLLVHLIDFPLSCQVASCREGDLAPIVLAGVRHAAVN